MDRFLSLSDYIVTQISPIGEVIVLTISLLIFVLIYLTRIIREAGAVLVRRMVMMCFFASIVRLVEYVVMTGGTVSRALVYTLRCGYYGLVLSVVFLFAAYIQSVLNRGKKERKRVLYLSGITCLIAIAFDIILSISGANFYLLSDGRVNSVTGNPLIVYILFMYIVVVVSVIRTGRRVSNRVRGGIIASAILSAALIFVQNMFNNQYWLTFAVLLPIISGIFIFNTGSYDSLSSTMVPEILISELDKALKNGKKKHMMLIDVRDLEDHLKNDPEFIDSYRGFLNDIVSQGLVCRMWNTGIVILYDGPMDAEKMEVEEEVICRRLDGLKVGYKILCVETDERVTKAAEYIDLLAGIRKKMPSGSCKIVGNKDFELFSTNRYILSELIDIYSKRDLDDERVLAFCQPVLNLKTGKYDTAEALMRLSLEKTGIVYPDQFIPLAEEYQTIHVMTLIILNKTCAFIRKVLSEGHDIKRISVNFSMLDLKEESFCKEVLDIIEKNNISPEKIAIEVTESLTSSDLEEIKPKVIMLHERGITFYLDDFGTGYSNFDRIMELPFQIIKFDRSLVIQSAKNDESRYMVGSFAKMFRHLDYNILFEGVENEEDEKNCREMDAQYLQGYKYSKPIPIYDLERFVS